jgi:hypothetical protein
MLRQKTQPASSQHGDVTEPAEALLVAALIAPSSESTMKKVQSQGTIVNVVNLWPLHPFVELTAALARCNPRTSGLLAFKLRKYIVSFDL